MNNKHTPRIRHLPNKHPDLCTLDNLMACRQREGRADQQQGRQDADLKLSDEGRLDAIELVLLQRASWIILSVSAPTTRPHSGPCNLAFPHASGDCSCRKQQIICDLAEQRPEKQSLARDGAMDTETAPRISLPCAIWGRTRADRSGSILRRRRGLLWRPGSLAGVHAKAIGAGGHSPPARG